MFDKIVSIYKEVKRLMDKKLELQAEVQKEVIVACKEAVGAVRTDCKEAIKAVRNDCKEAVKALVSNPQNKRATAVAIVGIGLSVGAALVISSFGPVAA